MGVNRVDGAGLEPPSGPALFLPTKGISPRHTNDIWIAASAMQYGTRVVTTDGHYRNVHQVVAACYEP
jgi:predicted nucleic acid-binding protein